ncbi:RHS repeat-associated core domain-containing protein [Micromonospora sp. PLK6-60]|uniref:RHS repeat-associated core domain-containing protein n=1 Tax=Micromonospora sp. PLK6-60 TaxID=2873383 RepID=UPI00210335F1|nr:RHS repeat-associated core domain-containing protein [Micromonospora sp. PLK6-60]
MLRSTELMLPGVAEDVTIGATFNSLLLGSGLSAGAHGPGWRTRAGQDVKLYPADDGSVTYAAADAVVGKFTASGSGYSSPGEFKATLAHDGSGWKLTEHGSGKKLYFGSDGLLDKTEDRNGNVTDVAYASGRMTTITSDRGPTSARTAAATWTDNKIGKYRQTGSDGSWREASYAYDSSGRLQTIQSATWRKVMFEYNGAGDLTKITTKDDTFVTITYDGQHRVTSFTQVHDNATMRGSTTRLAYPTSSQTLVADARQDISQPVSAVPHTTYDLNAEKRVTKATDPAGNSQSKTYTPFSDVASSVSREQGTTANTHGANSGQSLTKSESATGASASATYGNAATTTNPTANFQPSSSIDSQGNSSAYTYNGAGNQTSTADAMAAKAEVDYNDDGTVKTSTDPANTGNPTSYTYDTSRQLTKVTPPTGNGLAVKTFTYDPYGRIKTVNDGCTTTYTYTQDDRVSQIDYSGCGTQPSVTFDYGGTGNLLTRVDATGTTTWSYDPLNRVRERSNPGGGILKYVPDPVGNLEQLTDGRGTTRYYYNSRNWLVRMDTAAGTRYNFLYDKDGNRTHTYFGTNDANSSWALRTQTTYDKSNRPTRITATRNSASPATVFDVTYCYAKYTAGQPCSTAKANDTGLRQWQKDEVSAAISQFSYDKANRLTKATNYHGKTYDYTYDSNGNRTGVKVDGASTQSLTYNSANQITSTYNTYDGRGNQTRASSPTVNPMTYNSVKQMTGANAGTYAYAGTDQVELTHAGSTTIQNGLEDQHGMPWLQSWTANGSTTYVERDGLGTPLGLRTGSTDNAYVLDGLGSVVAIVKANGTVAATYRYDPYGTATTADEYNLGQTNLIRYASGTYDSTSGFTKFGQRWYNPVQGRFTQQDNLSFIGNPRSGNRYAYAGANPVTYTDPTGMMSEGDELDGQSLLLGGIVGGLLGFGLASAGLPVLAAGAISGCVGGMVSNAISQRGNVSADGLAFNCMIGAAVGTVFGVIARGGYRGGA